MHNLLFNQLHHTSRLPIILASLLLVTGCGANLEFIALHPVYRMKVINTFNIAAVSYETPAVKMSAVEDKGSASKSGKANRIESWKDLASKHRLPDFTRAISRQLVKGMSADAGVMNLHVDNKPLRLTYKKDLVFYKQRYSDSNYVLEVIVKNLTVEDTDHAGNNHALIMHVQGQMIRQYYSKVIWKYHCLISGNKNKTYSWKTEDFFANDGKRIKEVYSHAIINCAKTMVDDYLNYNR